MTVVEQLVDDLRVLKAAERFPLVEELGHPDLGGYLFNVTCGLRVPDLTSPCDVGCLAALAREASGKPYLHAEHLNVWGIADGKHWLGHGSSTEGEAWAWAVHAIRMEVAP